MKSESQVDCGSQWNKLRAYQYDWWLLTKQRMLHMWELFLNGNQTEESIWSPNSFSDKTQKIYSHLQGTNLSCNILQRQSDGAASPGQLDAEFDCATECRNRRSCCTWAFRETNEKAGGWNETMDQCSPGLWGISGCEPRRYTKCIWKKMQKIEQS